MVNIKQKARISGMQAYGIIIVIAKERISAALKTPYQPFLQIDFC